MKDEHTFWCVWNPAGRTPTVRHDSEGHATREAERLARENPGHKFYVLEATSLRVVDAMVRVKLEREIPF